jgi:hypothetical protein
MAAITSVQKEKSSPNIALIVVAFVVLAIGGGVSWYLQRPEPAQQGPVLTNEARAYIHDNGLKLSEVEMKATKSYMNLMLVEIIGKIGNAGQRNVKQVDLNCVFYDAYGQLVLRQRVSIVKPKTGGLAPDETKPFRLAFDTLPESWNQQMPQLVIAQILFE